MVARGGRGPWSTGAQWGSGRSARTSYGAQRRSNSLYFRSFTAPDTTPWTDAGFTAVLGNVAATIQGNAGHCGTIEQERIFRATAFPQTPNYKALATLTWKNAAGAGRIAGIALRASSDGKDAYLFELDCNVDAARVRIRRRRNDTVTDLTGWIDVSGSPYLSWAPPSSTRASR